MGVVGMSTRKILIRVDWHVWYPEPQKCGICHSDSHDIFRVEYRRINAVADVVLRRGSCPDCLRSMERSPGYEVRAIMRPGGEA